MAVEGAAPRGRVGRQWAEQLEEGEAGERGLAGAGVAEEDEATGVVAGEQVEGGQASLLCPALEQQVAPGLPMEASPWRRRISSTVASRRRFRSRAGSGKRSSCPSPCVNRPALMPINLATTSLPTAESAERKGFSVTPTELGLLSPSLQLGDTQEESRELWR